MRNDYAAAGRYYERILEIDPNQPDAHYNLAICLARIGRRERATEHLREALRLQPGHAAARQSLARLMAEPQRAP